MNYGERRRLPDRRPAISHPITFHRSDGTEWKVEATIGFYPRDGEPYAAGDPGEIFLFGPKDGTDMSALCGDASVLISIALQHGAPIEVLAEAISRYPVEVDGPPVKPASIIGAALDAILAVKRETNV